MESQPHGGALVRDGSRGRQKPGSGRRSFKLRRLAGRAATQHIGVIEDILAGRNTKATPGNQVAAFRALSAVALGKAITAQELRERLIEQFGCVRGWAAENGVEGRLLESLLDAIERAWR